jgi:hypothetical protein
MKFVISSLLLLTTAQSRRRELFGRVNSPFSRATSRELFPSRARPRTTFSRRRGYPAEPTLIVTLS